MCGCIDDASSIFGRHTALQRTVEVGSGYENQRVLRPAPCSDINFFWLGEPVTCASPAAGILQQNTTVLQLPNIVTPERKVVNQISSALPIDLFDTVIV
jgi:hypothetical protein